MHNITYYILRRHVDYMMYDSNSTTTTYYYIVVVGTVHGNGTCTCRSRSTVHIYNIYIDHINQAPQQPTTYEPLWSYGAVSQETCYQCFTPLSSNLV